MKIEAVEGSYTFTGVPVIPSPVVSISGNRLTEGTDYKVTIIGNDHPGTATLIIEGLPPYKGRIVQTFEIKDNDIRKGSGRSQKQRKQRSLENTVVSASILLDRSRS